MRGSESIKKNQTHAKATSARVRFACPPVNQVFYLPFALFGPWPPLARGDDSSRSSSRFRLCCECELGGGGMGCPL